MLITSDQRQQLNKYFYLLNKPILQKKIIYFYVNEYYFKIRVRFYLAREPDDDD